MTIKKYGKQFDRALSVFIIALVATPVMIAAANNGKQSIETAQAQKSLQNTFQTESVFDSAVIGIGGFTQGKLSNAQATFATYLGDQRHHAVALELDGGPKLFRVNATYGLALTERQRLKFTAERLAEKRSFDFTTSSVDEWIGQNAIGAEYAYLVNSKWFESVGFGGYVSRSESKDLPDVVLREETGDSGAMVEHRRIAGADTANIHSNMALHLWPHSRLAGGLDYDSVRYATKYQQHYKDVHGLGGHVQLEQLLAPQLKLTANTKFQRIEHEFGGGIGWLLPSSMPMELQATASYIDNVVTKDRYFSGGLRLNVSLGDSQHHKGYKPSYTDLETNSAPSLLDWTRVPAVRMTQVIATADSEIETLPQMELTTTDNSLEWPSVGSDTPKDDNYRTIEELREDFKTCAKYGWNSTEKCREYEKNGIGRLDFEETVNSCRNSLRGKKGPNNACKDLMTIYNIHANHVEGLSPDQNSMTEEEFFNDLKMQKDKYNANSGKDEVEQPTEETPTTVGQDCDKPGKSGCVAKENPTSSTPAAGTDEVEQPTEETPTTVGQDCDKPGKGGCVAKENPSSSTLE